MDPRTALVVGNGFTISHLHCCDPTVLAKWPPRSPLSWPVTVGGQPISAALPRLFRECNALRSADAPLTDFEIIDEVTRLAATRASAAPGNRAVACNAAMLVTEVLAFPRPRVLGVGPRASEVG